MYLSYISYKCQPLYSTYITLSIPADMLLLLIVFFLSSFFLFFFFFFFQAEDGIRDLTVTGVQTCALPISKPVQILLEANPSTQPYVQDYTFEGFITCGAAIGLTSVGCTTFPAVADQLGDAYVWNILPDTLPTWAQGELVWDQTQQAGGMFIYEMVEGGTNDHRGYRETGESPALAYWNTSTLQEFQGVVLSDGIDYRVFGGPHPLLAPGGPVLPPREECPDVPAIGFNPCSFGFGVTLNQDFTSYMHMFYNWVPDEGWRFTVDGPPEAPQ